MLTEENFITHDFKLPNHHNELCKAEEVIEKLKNKFKKIERTKTINDKNHDELYNEILLRRNEPGRQPREHYGRDGKKRFIPVRPDNGYDRLTEQDLLPW